MEPTSTSPRITPFLWFDNNAAEAVSFYQSVFHDAATSTAEAPPANSVTIAFELGGQRFIALNGGPHHKFNEAVSFSVRCDSQQEIDEYWSKLSDGGSEGRCGWLKDKFGLSWQIVPARLSELLSSQSAVQAMMKMKKLDIAELERAGS
jgi:predicted 3-demethylubiquinone-9 3-methyltransferase (glyoxalase superfamily)